MDLFDLVMQGHDVYNMHDLIIDDTVDTAALDLSLSTAHAVHSWHRPCDDSVTMTDFDRTMQSRWHMPDQYQHLDIAEHVLSKCKNDAELQRAGQELLLYQERGLFNLLRYLKYLVDTMTQHGLVWGVGRGSSVASFVLYLLGVHRVNSLYYDLDPTEFLR